MSQHIDIDCNVQGETPIFVACLNGRFETVKALVQLNADINERNDKAIDVASVVSVFAVGLWLSGTHDIDVHCVTYGEVPVFVAALNGKVEAVKALVQLNADVNECNQMVIDFSSAIAFSFCCCPLGGFPVHITQDSCPL